MFTKFHETRERGFTLIELIIVIAILGILAAIALSRLNYQRTRAANNVCNSKMGEVKKAAEAYYVETGTAVSGGPGIISNNNNVLIVNRFLAGIPTNPHNPVVPQVNFYAVAVGNDNPNTEQALVSCPGIVPNQALLGRGNVGHQ